MDDPLNVPLPPDDLKFTCELCGAVMFGAEAGVDHIEREHPDVGKFDRWADGGLVFDTTAALPEVLG